MDMHLSPDVAVFHAVLARLSPDDVLAAPPEKIRELARLLDMPEVELRKKLDSDRSEERRVGKECV